MFDAIEITTSDQVPIQLEVFRAESNYTLVVNPAIGVKRRLYHQFAEFLSAQGITVVLYNYRGMEDGMGSMPEHTICDVESWGRLDQSAVMAWVKGELQPRKLWVLGHSLGGQIFGFAKNTDTIDGLIHVAAQKGDKRLWSIGGYLKLLLLWHVFIPWMSRGKTFNAKKLGLGSYPWPAAAAKQWASWGRQKDYLFNPKFAFDLSPWHNFNSPVLSFGFTDDDMAPEAAIDGLLEECGQNHDHKHIEKRIIDPKSLGLDSIGHFGFFKAECQSLWQDIITWIKNN